MRHALRSRTPRLRVVSTQIHADAKRTLERIASMLIKLAKSLEEPS